MDKKIQVVDLSGLDNGLRHYVATANGDGYIVLEHRIHGTLLRVAEDTFRSRLEMLAKATKKLHAMVAVTVLERLLPELCVDCGLPVLEGETTLCGTCQDRQVADLLRISGDVRPAS